jgi:hypothetical protein
MLFRETVPVYCENHTVLIITTAFEGHYYSRMHAYVLPEVIYFPGIPEPKSDTCYCFSSYATSHTHLIIFYITVYMQRG